MLFQRRPNTNVKNEVKIVWYDQDKLWWNEATAQVLERFGLPGKRYTTSVNKNHLSFKFYSAKDATMCRLVLSEYI